MATNSMDLTSFVGKLLKEDDSDILRDGIKPLAQMIMDVEVSSNRRTTGSTRGQRRAFTCRRCSQRRMDYRGFTIAGIIHRSYALCDMCENWIEF